MVSSNLLTLHYFTKTCYVYFVEPCYFSYTYKYILKCFTWKCVYKENDLWKEVEFWKGNKICENNDDMKNMILCMNACNAQRLGGDYAPDTLMLGRGKQSCLTA